MSDKIQRTTFGVMTSHVISSSSLFPALWLIVGLIGKSILISENLINETLANSIYYAIMLLFFYFGTKYSLYYINKKVAVSFPKESGQQSIILFISLVILVNFGLFYFEQSLNTLRNIFSLLLVYMFITLTKKFFNSLEETGYLECTFIGQISVILANLSILTLFVIPAGFVATFAPKEYMLEYFIFMEPTLFIIMLIIYWKTDIFKKLSLLSFFYQHDEPKPIKKASVILAITLPVNSILFYVLIYINYL